MAIIFEGPEVTSSVSKACLSDASMRFVIDCSATNAAAVIRFKSVGSSVVVSYTGSMECTPGEYLLTQRSAHESAVYVCETVRAMLRACGEK